jgi:hypothetical protein
LHPYDYNALNRLCRIYNILRAQIICSQEQHRELAEVPAPEVALAIEQLQQLKFDLTECFKLAQQEIEAKGDTFINTVMYIPQHQRYRNSNSSSKVSTTYLFAFRFSRLNDLRLVVLNLQIL